MGEAETIAILGGGSVGVAAAAHLMMTGYEQVRSIAAELAGDHAAARRVELILPETGVCSGPGRRTETPSASACCAPAAPKPSVKTGCCG
jgi:hypothetical protein